MIVRDGTTFNLVVPFPTGRPNTVTWAVRDGAGVIGNGTITPAVDAVSTVIQVSSALNTLDVGTSFEPRDVEWSYTLGGVTTNGEARYIVEARLPVGISADGVRAKLAASPVELPDGDISLVRAFLIFRDRVTSDVLDAAYDGALADIAIRDAVEAIAAKALLPTMPIRIASAEESGTNKFKRQAIDWEAIGASLDDLINQGFSAVIEGFDPTTDFGTIFLLATPATDAITGA
jgi:hypothetical protein